MFKILVAFSLIAMLFLYAKWTYTDLIVPLVKKIKDKKNKSTESDLTKQNNE